jgi:hypothetical protein
LLLVRFQANPDAVAVDEVSRILEQAEQSYAPEIPTLQVLLAGVLRRTGDADGAAVLLDQAEANWRRMEIAPSPQACRLRAAVESL